MANKRQSKERIKSTKNGKWSHQQLVALPPEDKEFWECEPASKGFCIRVSPAGKKTFIFRYNNLGKRKYINLGEFGTTDLKDARIAATNYANQLLKGVDPAQEIEHNKAAALAQQRKSEADKKTPTLNTVLDTYLSKRSANTQSDAGRLFSNKFCDVRTELGITKIKEITEEDISELVDKHINRGKMRNAGKLYAYLQAAFKQAKKNPQFGLKGWSNPFDNLEKPEGTDSKAINRSLSADEIKQFWNALNTNPSDMMTGTVALLKVLLLTGQRVEQTSRMQWDHLDLTNSTWDIPPEETKTGKRTGVGHIVPLTSAVITIIQSMPQFDGEPFVFPGRHGGKPFSISGISNPLQKLLNESKIEHFTARDLRRTFTTHLSRLGVLAEIRNRIQDHAIAGDVESKHYNRFDYMDQKRAALKLWEQELSRITNSNSNSNSNSNNVIQLHQHAS